MDNKELEEKIARMDLNSIYNTSPKALKELTNDFSEPLVRLLMIKEKTIGGQKNILNYIKKAYGIWQRRTKFIWSEHPGVGGYPEYFDTMEANIESDRYITTNGSVPVGSFEYFQLVSQQKEIKSSETHTKEMVDAAVAAVKAQIPHFEYDQQNESLSVVYGEDKGKINLDEIIEKKTNDAVNKQLEEISATNADSDEMFADVYGQDLVDQVNKEIAEEIEQYDKDEEENALSDTNSINMEQSLLNNIPANNICYYYEGWRNGKHGSICLQNGIYRFVEQARGQSGILAEVKKNNDDNPIVAIGIVAYWLQFNSRKALVLKRLTKYNCEIPKDIREQFDNYTRIKFEQFREEHRDDPNTWEWDWDFEFYTNHIIPQEIALNKQTEALFDFISDSDIALVRAVMNSYIKYLKKIRTKKGYQVSPELLVLRAIDSGDETKQEDLEEFEVNTILDNLEGKGCINVVWLLGHKPWEITMLDKGRALLKHLEEGSGVVKTASIVEIEPVVTPQLPPKENTVDIPPQTPKMPQTPKGSGHIHLIEEEEWDDTFDYIFNEKIKPQEIKKALASIVRPKKISEVRFYYVSCRILEILYYFTENALRTDFMRWINLHFKCGWPDDKKHKRRFSFALEGSSKNLENQHPSQWDEKTIKGGSGIYHQQLAIKLKNTFTQTMINGKAIDDSNSFEHLIDRGQYLRFANHLRDNDYYIPEEAYINNGK